MLKRIIELKVRKTRILISGLEVKSFAKNVINFIFEIDKIIENKQSLLNFKYFSQNMVFSKTI